MCPSKAGKIALHWTFQEVQDISDNTREVTALPKTIVYDHPVQIWFMVYQYAKMKILSFYYDILVKFIDKRDFEMCEMDT